VPRNLKRSVQQLALGYHSYAPSFSCAGEDMILRHLIGADKMDGFFIDVGAYHPVLLSNTYFFYLNGWRGINIEVRPGSRALFEVTRPRDINVEVGISSERGEMTYYFIGDDSPMNSFSRKFLEEIGMIGQIERETRVPVLPLAAVLAEHLPPGQEIDFMTVDVEGLDLSVLESNDWNAFRPRFLVVEDMQVDVQRSEAAGFMRTQGYEVCAQNAIILDKINEYFFVDRSR
jgi:FkbM family methyltransferase